MAYVPGSLETDPKKQNSSLRSLNDELGDAQGTITTNTANIATNTANIATNTTNIATNTTNIASNSSAITALQTAGQGLVNSSGSLAVSLSKITASLSGDVSLSNVANYFDGPSIAQGTTGTWFVSGSVSVLDTASGANFSFKLWDGTTIIASGFCDTNAANAARVVALSGYLASPAGNLRISVKDSTSVNGKIKFNSSGNSLDSTISAIRIA
jgi:hypothetical protein